jgi:hypothetical protein
MHFHIVKIYKDKEVKNNVKNIFLSMNDVNMFLTFKIRQQPETGTTVMTLTWDRNFERNGGLNHILKRQTSRSHYGSKVPAVTITVFKIVRVR